MARIVVCQPKQPVTRLRPRPVIIVRSAGAPAAAIPAQRVVVVVRAAVQAGSW